MPVHLSTLATYYGRGHHPEPPRHLGTRYDQSGKFLPEPGNTVVCHLVPGSATEQALVDARARYMGMPDAGKLAFTPVESYHMTLFQGIIEGRRNAPYWPAEVATDTPIAAMTELFAKRLELFPGRADFAVEIVEALPTGLVVEGATAADRHAMADWRNAFADIFGYRHPDHDSYQFHITMAYLIDWLDDAVLPSWQTMLDEVAEDIRRRAPVLELRAPAFCSFEDMNWFEELRVFGTVEPVS
ncbi:DUF1868 domain-containing protein [Devosia lacusdianchii]|uniref:DUF1868 domain-containing protein n=1 Tax=Devosia lacusdianchii TaxID=2917991 RepID=UPI001F06899A|nr:DUF1868 domain-containing protein [Devosia sp. JXJ CY 41]